MCSGRINEIYLSEQELFEVLEFIMKFYSEKKKEKIGIKIWLELLYYQE